MDVWAIRRGHTESEYQRKIIYEKLRIFIDGFKSIFANSIDGDSVPESQNAQQMHLVMAVLGPLSQFATKCGKDEFRN
jgi:hypothetical protein